MNYTQIINKTEDYIEHHLDEKITLSNLAQSVGLSEFHYHRIFRKYTQETLHQYIRRVKMERSAIYLLTNQTISLTEIAYRYGYSDASAYIRSFKSHFNMTPSQYRKRKI